MNGGEINVRKAIFWGGMITLIILGFNLLIGGHQIRYGHVPPRGGFGGHHFMYGPHHGGGFSWLGFLIFLLIIITSLVLFAKWLKRRAKKSSMQQFIDTSLASSYKPIMNQNDSILDQWEKNLKNNKENI